MNPRILNKKSTNYPGTLKHWYKESFAMVWLTSSHFTEMERVNEEFDPVTEFTELVDEDVEKAKRYLDYWSAELSMSEIVPYAILAKYEEIVYQQFELGLCSSFGPLFERCVRYRLFTWEKLAEELISYFGDLDAEMEEVIIAITNKESKLQLIDAIKNLQDEIDSKIRLKFIQAVKKLNIAESSSEEPPHKKSAVCIYLVE